MNRSPQIFRYVWRINAVLILVAAAAVVLGVVMILWSEYASSVRSESANAAAPVVAGTENSKKLRLEGLNPIEGTSLYRGILSTSERGGVSSMSSGGYSTETRNVLIVDGATGAARWVLPRNNQLIVYNEDVRARTTSDGPAPLIATVLLVKPFSSDPHIHEGTLLVSDASASDVRELTSGVREVHGSSVTANGQLSIIFEQRREYRLALLDATTRRVVSNRVVAVPQLR